MSSEDKDLSLSEGTGQKEDKLVDGDAAAGGQHDQQPDAQPADQPQQQEEELKDGLKPTPVVYISALLTFLFFLGVYDFVTSRWSSIEHLKKQPD